MTDEGEGRIDRIEALARQVFEGPAWVGRVRLLTQGSVDVLNEHGGLLLGVTEHPRALEAIHAALRVLAGESASVGDQVPALVADLDVRLADAVAKLRELQESVTVQTQRGER